MKALLVAISAAWLAQAYPGAYAFVIAHTSPSSFRSANLVHVHLVIVCAQCCLARTGYFHLTERAASA